MGEGFFQGESWAYKASQYPPWLVVFLSVLPTRRWPLLPLLHPLELPWHCGHRDADRKKSADGETLSRGILGILDFQHQFCGISCFHHKCNLCFLHKCCLCVLISLSECDGFFCVCVCAYTHPTCNPAATTACAHDQQKEPKKLTVSLSMSPGCSPVWAC